MLVCVTNMYVLYLFNVLELTIDNFQRYTYVYSLSISLKIVRQFFQICLSDSMSVYLSVRLSVTIRVLAIIYLCIYGLPYNLVIMSLLRQCAVTLTRDNT